MTISVVIPAYNEEDFLAACLESLKNQTRQADEIIVVDNNSTDSTTRITKRYGVRIVRESRQGIMPAVCTGYSACTGDIIARCDADSVLPPNWLETIERELAMRPDTAGVTGPGTFYGTHRFAASWAQVWYMYAYFVLAGAALANWPLFGSNCAFRRSIWLDIQDSVHNERNDIHDDIDFSMHIPARRRVVFLPSMRAGISSRSLQANGLFDRYCMGFRSLTIHWPAQAPWNRWMTLLTNKAD